MTSDAWNRGKCDKSEKEKIDAKAIANMVVAACHGFAIRFIHMCVCVYLCLSAYREVVAAVCVNQKEKNKAKEREKESGKRERE